MKSTPGIPDTEEYNGYGKPHTARILTAVAILLTLGPASCRTMTGPIWGSTSDPLLNAWYERTRVLGALIFFIGPLLLFLADRLHRWLSRGIIRWSLVALQWMVTAVFFLNLSDPWRQVITREWQGNDFTVVEHPIVNGCFYLSVLLSGILWTTFRGDHRWWLRALCEFIPFALLIVGRIYLSSLHRPGFNWG